jgi:hypothetical protein
MRRAYRPDRLGRPVPLSDDRLGAGRSVSIDLGVMSQWSVTPHDGSLPSIAPLDALLARTAEGDAEAFAELYDRVAPRVLGFIRQFVADPQQGEGVCFDVFVDVWRRASRFDPRHGSALAWILQSAHGRAVAAASGSGSGSGSGSEDEIAISA